MEILIITGPPYSGKGTQCKILKEELGYNHISTGDRCRIEKENKTQLGILFTDLEKNGELVPDSMIKVLFGQILDENSNLKGIILDGYPRTIAQVDNLIELITLKELKIKKVLNIELPTEELLKRAKNRALSSNREDDKDAYIHQKRIEVFEENTKPCIEYMKSKFDFVSFNGMGSINEITERIKSYL